MPRQYQKTANSLYFESIKGKVLDKFLAHGWYRMGPGIFTCHYIFYQGELLSTIWLRTVLENYTLSKSLRKIDRKNKQMFTHQIEAFEHSTELEELYYNYTKTFKGKLPQSLHDYMSGSLDTNVYDTKIVKIYHDEKLIAASIIDIGQETLASIFGMYDPKYQKYSLGIYTMMLEIEYCQAADMPYYYMGYFVPGNPRFDYKLRVGHIEFYDMKTEVWQPHSYFDFDLTPIEVSKRKLKLLADSLQEILPVTVNQNAYIDAYIIEYFPIRYMEYPLMIILDDLNYPLEKKQKLIVVFDIKRDSYLLLLCDMIQDGLSNYNPTWLEKLDPITITQEFAIYKVIKKCKTVKPIMRWVKTHLNDS